MRLQDRRQAGELLAGKLLKYRQAGALVLGIPRGGVVVAAPVARRLGAPLDVLVTRKVVLPEEPELALGAVAPDGEVLWRIDPPQGPLAARLERQVELARQEMERRLAVYREGRPRPKLRGRTVILVDDGLATGFTALAALRYLTRAGTAVTVLAVPVAPPETVRQMAEEADEVVCLETPVPFLAVGQFYAEFSQVSDEEVRRLLRENGGADPSLEGV